MHTPSPSTPHATSSAHNLRIAMVVAQWHQDIVTPLTAAATACFHNAGGDPAHLLTIEVPGAWELGSACGRLINTLDPPPDAIVAIGCVIRGETQHDRWINHGVSSALASLGAHHGIPVTMGVLTCDTHDQAMDRAGGSKGNKGEEAMHAAIETVISLQAAQWSSSS